jgi:hypothetical protein
MANTDTRDRIDQAAGDATLLAGWDRDLARSPQMEDFFTAIATAQRANLDLMAATTKLLHRMFFSGLPGVQDRRDN